MLLNEISTHKNHKPIDDTSTGVFFYDNLLANPEVAEYHGWEIEVVYMSPIDYISKAANGFPGDKSPQEIIDERKASSDKVSKIAQKMMDGTTFDMPYLAWTWKGHFSQEGLHRAIAALEIGYDTIPVLVAKEQD